jgi:phage protein D
MKSRRASVELIYEGKNITNDIAPDLKSFTFNDNASGAADDAAIELKDDLGKWISGWAPSKGDIIMPTIITENWNYEGDSQRFYCGRFVIDEPSYSGRPRVLSLGAVSAPADSKFMTVEHSRTWQKASVKKIAQSIAANADLALYFNSSFNPVIPFVEQSKEADAAFLANLCQQNGLAIKIYNQEIVIFNEMEYEAKSAVPALTICESDLIQWSAKTTFTNTGYDGCKISYTNPKSHTTFTYTFKPSGKAGSKIYQINETAGSLAEAELYARCRLRELNKKEFTLSLELPGNLELVPTQVVTIEDLGIFNGNYYIDKVSHKISGGFTTGLELHKCLVGY